MKDLAETVLSTYIPLLVFFAISFCMWFNGDYAYFASICLIAKVIELRDLLLTNDTIKT